MNGNKCWSCKKTIFVNIVAFQMYSLECDLNVTPNRKSKFTLEVMAQPKNVMPLTLTYTDKTIRPESFLMSEGDLSMFHGKNILPKLPTFKMDFITLILMQSARRPLSHLFLFSGSICLQRTISQPPVSPVIF